MTLTSASIHLALLYLSVAIATSVAVFAYRNRDVPGAKPFTVLMVSIALWSLTHAVSLQTPDPGTRVLWFYAGWLPMAYLPVWLLLFALTYTGYDRFVTRRSLAALSVVPTVAVIGMWTNGWHGLMWTGVETYLVEGLVLQDFSWNVLYWLLIVWSYAVILVAAMLFLRLIVASEYLYFDQAALLLVGILAPLLVNAADVLQYAQGPTLDYTTVAFTVTGTSFGYALFRRRLFDLVPATRHLGRSEAVGQLDAGILVVDTDYRVVYANEAACDVFGIEAAAVLGDPVRSFVDDEWLDLDAEDALAEVTRDDRTFEIRSSQITDRHGRDIGCTLVIHDVTLRERRERELETVNELNRVIRGVNQALVTATSREEIEHSVCDRLVESELYTGICLADVQTWSGDADRWHVAGEAFAAEATDGGVGPSPPEIQANDIRTTGEEAALATSRRGDNDAGNWIVVPVVYGRTVYGAMGIRTERDDVSEEERSVLGEFGQLVGHAINAVESRRLIGAENVVELSVTVDGQDDPLAAATAHGDTTIEVKGVVPRSGEGHHAFLSVTGESLEAVRDRLAAEGLDARTVRSDADGGLLELVVDAGVPLGPIVTSDVHLLRGRIVDGASTYEVLVPSASGGRRLLDRLREAFPSTDLHSKRDRDHPIDAQEGVLPQQLDELTNRQREALDAAYRAGYFKWPRDASAEDVAETMNISSPTLHSHLRKAQETLFSDLFGDQTSED